MSLLVKSGGTALLVWCPLLPPRLPLLERTRFFLFLADSLICPFSPHFQCPPLPSSQPFLPIARRPMSSPRSWAVSLLYSLAKDPLLLPPPPSNFRPILLLHFPALSLHSPFISLFSLPWLETVSISVDSVPDFLSISNHFTPPSRMHSPVTAFLTQSPGSRHLALHPSQKRTPAPRISSFNCFFFARSLMKYSEGFSSPNPDVGVIDLPSSRFFSSPYRIFG